MFDLYRIVIDAPALPFIPRAALPFILPCPAVVLFAQPASLPVNDWQAMTGREAGWANKTAAGQGRMKGRAAGRMKGGAGAAIKTR